MSNAASNWVYGINTGSTTTKAVLAYLAWRANEHWRCWPALDTIARETQFSRRAVLSALKALEAGGFISREARGRDGGGRSSNSYQLQRVPMAAQRPAEAGQSADVKGPPHGLLGGAKVRHTDYWGKGPCGGLPKVRGEGGKGAAGSPEPYRTNKNTTTVDEIPARESVLTWREVADPGLSEALRQLEAGMAADRRRKTDGQR